MVSFKYVSKDTALRLANYERTMQNIEEGTALFSMRNGSFKKTQFF